ncbi:hypothetical protein Pan216_08230 [Planctomycetes bacterium Pan216]|uniref:Uncharacterized protein n=1 Tax=Kolteria novifilia TaxID=2527975 RepID=A0A518AZ41_9BACT|nr:hypothetical protein Pan216_08230 [Planctomycetes bacterium Pan216]
MTETVFDPHYQRQQVVTQLAALAGFEPKEYFGNWLTYNLNLQKPAVS